MAISDSILLFFFLLIPFAVTTSSLDLKISHPDINPATPPLTTILNLAAHSDPTRLLFLSRKTASSYIPVASGQQFLQTPSYILRASLGTPPQPLLLSLDTSSDLTWTPCSPCNSCPATSFAFSPANSTSYSPLPCSSPLCSLFQPQPYCPPSSSTPAPCSYSQLFSDATLAATASQDSLRLGSLDAVPNYTFGCVNSITGAGVSNVPKQGLLGLGRGPGSLISQTGSLYKGVFSYCLPSYKNYYFSGSLRLGPAGQPKSAASTPLLKNPHRPSLYYVNVTGLSVGKAPVSVPAGSFAFDPATGAGTIVDTGTVISRFTTPVYAALRDEFRRQVGAPGGYTSLGAFDTCYNMDEVSGAAPAVTIHMSGLDLVLPVENTMIHSSATPLACLAMAEAPANVNSVVNVIANLQQQNLRVVIDAANSRVSFARELCN